MGDQPSAKATPAESQRGGGPHDESVRRSPTGFLGNLSKKSLGVLGALFTAVVVSIVTTIVTGWLPGGHSATLSHTSSILFQPWTFAGKVSVDLHIASKVTGFCWAESIATPRQDAYRCMAGNFILDPCFAGPNGPDDQVVCTYPSPQSVTVMRLTKPLPFFSAPSSLSSPWLLILADGEHCYYETGGTTSPGGMRLNYECSRNSNLYGNINKADHIWTIFQQRNGSSDMTQAQIAKAYY